MNLDYMKLHSKQCIRRSVSHTGDVGFQQCVFSNTGSHEGAFLKS